MGFPDQGFLGMGNTIFQIFFWGVFFFIVSVFFTQIFKNVKEKNDNDKSEILKRPATVISKRIYVRNFTTYYVTFEFDNNERREFHVSGDEYGLLVENDYGLLTFQGTRF